MPDIWEIFYNSFFPIHRVKIRINVERQINLKSELEIRTLHEKIDHLIIHQQRDLFEIQQVHMNNERYPGE